MHAPLNYFIVKTAFENACMGKEYLDKSDFVIFWIELFGECPDEGLMDKVVGKFDVKEPDGTLGITVETVCSMFI
ncbi:unnamed protein product [Dicrocoelium dendriticum]|nr:unnamed protein product [Dicrocoelium dendriticum]